MVLSDFLRIADSHLIVGQGLFHMLSHMWLHTEFRVICRRNWRATGVAVGTDFYELGRGAVDSCCKDF